MILRYLFLTCDNCKRNNQFKSPSPGFELIHFFFTCRHCHRQTSCYLRRYGASYIPTSWPGMHDPLLPRASTAEPPHSFF